MTPAIQFEMNRQLRTHQSRLASWKGSVLTSDSPIDAFRKASRKPSPPAMIKGVRSMYQADEQSARGTIRNHLEKVASEMWSMSEINEAISLAGRSFPELGQKLQKLREKIEYEDRLKEDRRETSDPKPSAAPAPTPFSMKPRGPR